MKLIIAAGTAIFIVFAMASCSKNPVSFITPEGISAITGKWNMVTDSGFAGVGISNHAVNYTGRFGDYFDFRADGNVYTKEGAVLDTLQYTITSDSTMQIKSFNGVAYIKNITHHTVTINTILAITPGGIFGRRVELSR